MRIQRVENQADRTNAVPWMVSSMVRPVKTRMVSCFSPAVRVPHDGMSLNTGTFSGSQKFPVSRSRPRRPSHLQSVPVDR